MTVNGRRSYRQHDHFHVVKVFQPRTVGFSTRLAVPAQPRRHVGRGNGGDTELLAKFNPFISDKVVTTASAFHSQIAASSVDNSMCWSQQLGVPKPAASTTDPSPFCCEKHGFRFRALVQAGCRRGGARRDHTGDRQRRQTDQRAPRVIAAAAEVLLWLF